MEVTINYFEANQLEAALDARLEAALNAKPLMEPGTPEAALVDHEIQYTGSVLTKVREMLYLEEPTEPIWDLLGERAAHDEHELAVDDCDLCAMEMNTAYRSVVGWTESEQREAWGK